MSQLEQIKTNPSTRQARSRSNSTPSEASAHQPRLSRVFSAQHIDDSSYYHDHADRQSEQSEGTPAERSDFSEKVAIEDGLGAGDDVAECSEIREGIATERDLEAPLEKTKSARSARDPNLVGTAKVGRLGHTNVCIRLLGTAPRIRRILRIGQDGADGLQHLSSRPLLSYHRFRPQWLPQQ